MFFQANSQSEKYVFDRGLRGPSIHAIQCDTLLWQTFNYILQSIMQLYMCIWLYIYIYPLRMCSQFIQVVWPIYTTHFRVRWPAQIEASNLRCNNGRAMGPWRTKVTGRPNHQTSEVRSENIKTILIKHPEFHEAIHFFLSIFPQRVPRGGTAMTSCWSGCLNFLNGQSSKHGQVVEDRDQPSAVIQ